MHSNAGRWRHGGGIQPSVLSKREQRRRRCLFIIGLGAGKFLVWRKIFARISPNFHEKFLCNFYLQMLSHEDHEDLFWCDLQKRSSCDFLQTLGAIFLSPARLGVISTIFRDVSQIFSKSKLLGVSLTPTSNKHHCIS